MSASKWHKVCLARVPDQGNADQTPGVEPYTFGFIGKILGWSAEECKVLNAKVLAEVRDKSLHMYIRFYFVHGRKPENAVD